MNKYTLNDQITVITNATRDLLLEKNPDSLVLYMFYIKGTNYQGTNSVWHTDKFVRGGLKLPNGRNWGEKRLSDAKKVLLDNNLIEIDKRRNKDGSFEKTYIKVKYIFKHETKEKLTERDFNQNLQNADVVESSAGLNRTNALSNYNLNALSNYNLNALSSLKGNSRKEETKPERTIKYLVAIPEPHLAFFTSEFNCNPKQVENKGKELYSYCKSKGKVYKDYKHFLANALRKDFGVRKSYDELVQEENPGVVIV